MSNTHTQTFACKTHDSFTSRHIYLKAASVKDHSTKGFLNSNFSLCFIKWRPPSMQAA